MLHKDQITKKISPFIHPQLPLFLDLAHDVVSGKNISTFGRFIELYYEWLETSYDASVNDFALDSIDSYKDYAINGMMQETGNPYDRLVRLQSFRDVDNTTDTLLRYIRSEYVDDIPLTAKADRRKLVKRAKELYRIRGSEQSLYLIFKILYDKNISIFYPRDYVFNPSDSSYNKNKAIRVQEIGSTYAITDDDFDQWKGYYAVGATSGAKAVIADIDYFGIGTDFVADFFLDEDTMSGTFQVDEEIEAQTTDGYAVNKTGTTTQLRAKVFPSIQGVSFSNSGTGYYPDDAITLSGTTGSEIVIKSLKKGKIEDVASSGGNSNYVAGDKVVFSNTYAEVYDKIGSLFVVGAELSQWSDDVGLDTFTTSGTAEAKAKILAVETINGVEKFWLEEITGTFKTDERTDREYGASVVRLSLTSAGVAATAAQYRANVVRFDKLVDVAEVSAEARVDKLRGPVLTAKLLNEGSLYGTTQETGTLIGGVVSSLDQTAPYYQPESWGIYVGLTVASTTGWAVDETLTGSPSTATGTVVSVNSATQVTVRLLTATKFTTNDTITDGSNQTTISSINEEPTVSVPATHITVDTGLGGSGMTLNVNTNASGDITSHTITSGGTGYTADDFLIIADPSNVGIDYPDGATITTNGSLVVGLKYRITVYDGSDNFVSVGASRNAANVEFIATGESSTVSPTTWNDDSIVKPILETEAMYRIKTFETGDDFTNVGASSNATEQVFIATGSTPTTWTNGSVITKLKRAYFSVNEISGEQYSIIDFNTGDDFTNVGGTNQTGAVFTATGTTPATWDNNSKLQRDKQTTANVATSNASASGSGFKVNYKSTGGKITEISVHTAGTAYDGGVEVTIDGNEGSGTDARVEILTTGPTGSIARIEVVDGGVNYTTPPKARIQSENGANAVIVPYGTDIGAIESTGVVLYGKADTNSTVSFRDTNSVNSNFTRAVGTVTYGALVNYDGYSLSNKSMLNHPESLIEDLEKYQKWSYAVRVSEDPSNWIGRVKELAHPAGMRVTAEYEMDSLMTSSSTVTSSTVYLHRILTVASTTGWTVGETLTGSPSTATAKVISVDSATQVTVNLLTATELAVNDSLTDGTNQSTISAIDTNYDTPV